MLAVRSFCQTRYIPFIGVGKKELFKDCTDSSLWKNNIFSLVWKFRKYFIVALIFISKHSLWQYKPPKFPSKFVSIVAFGFLHKWTNSVCGKKGLAPNWWKKENSSKCVEKYYFPPCLKKNVLFLLENGKNWQIFVVYSPLNKKNVLLLLGSNSA